MASYFQNLQVLIQSKAWGGSAIHECLLLLNANAGNQMIAQGVHSVSTMAKDF